MRPRTVCIALFACLIAGGGWLLPGTAIAQRKVPAKTDAEADGQAKEKSESLWIRKLDWRSTLSRVKAPDYTYVNVVKNPPKIIPEWHMISVTYDTAPEWMDRIVVNFHVLLEKKGETGKAHARGETKEPKERAAPYTLLEGSVSYVDIKKGSGHISTMFIRPTTIDRRGSIVAAAVEIVSGEETVVKSEHSTVLKLSPESKQRGKWWIDAAQSDQVTVRSDGLLRRPQTPFILVNYLDEEAIQ